MNIRQVSSRIYSRQHVPTCEDSKILLSSAMGFEGCQKVVCSIQHMCQPSYKHRDSNASPF